ncbi:MAG: thiopurine S-methyltransferase [Alphaproteobacteria bacterium]|nr:MAG: thiopurine S-methyltransferase [Alphaproteobacteria bacterium]
MEQEFWHSKWEKKEIGFHQPSVNPLLEKHFASLKLEKGARVFVPLCGKTLDIHWLYGKGYHVTGAELSEIAVRELFDEMELTPTIRERGGLKQFSAERIDIFVGDFFALSKALLGATDAVYDRAALVALPSEMREKYARQLVEVTKAAPQLQITFTYDQSIMKGPPFSLAEDDIAGLYAADYNICLLESHAVDVKGNPAVESARLLLARA